MASAGLETLRAIISDDALRRVQLYADRMAEVYDLDVPRDTGELASAFRTDVSRSASVVRLHAEVDDGVAPHGKWIDDPVTEIVPVRARVLHWFSKSGDEVFARRVVPSRVHEGWWKRFVDHAVSNFGDV